MSTAPRDPGTYDAIQDEADKKVQDGVYESPISRRNVAIKKNHQQYTQDDADEKLQFRIQSDCSELRIPFNRNDPWGGLNEGYLQRITSYGRYNKVEARQMHLKCVGEEGKYV